MIERLCERSKSGRRRYRLGRFWGQGPVATVIGLNPSTADACQDDATNRRLVTLLHDSGLSGYWLVNLLPDVATDPRTVRWHNRRFSAWNRDAIARAVDDSERVIVAWGVHGAKLGFRGQISEMADAFWCFGVTQAGEPRHPLYLPRQTELVPYDFTAIESSSSVC